LLGNPYILSCPDGQSLCSWDEGTGWQSFWSSTTGERLLDFEVTPAGWAVVLVRAHGDDGRILLVDSEGEVRLTRELATGHGLRSVVGIGPRSTVNLCRGLLGAEECDTWVMGADGPGLSQMHPQLPKGCIFPRFREELVACVHVFPDPKLSIMSTTDGDTQAIEFRFENAEWIEDLHLLGRNLAVVEAAEALWLVTSGRADPISREEVIWSRLLGDNQLIFAECKRDMALEQYGCTVSRYTPGLGVAQVLETGRRVPVRASVVGDYSVLLDLWADDRARELVLLEWSDGASATELLWSNNTERPTEAPAPD